MVKFPDPMRPITKLLLLFVVAFFVFLLWPRSPSLREFDPASLAARQVEAWQKERAGGFGALVSVFKIYAFEYGMSPLASYQIASNEVGAVATLRKWVGDPGGGLGTRALLPLQEKYVLIKRQTNSEIDTDACARAEIAWRMIEMDGAKPQAVGASMAAELAVLHGGDRADYRGAARQFAGARAILFGAELPDGYPNRRLAALEMATDGYRELQDALEP